MQRDKVGANKACRGGVVKGISVQTDETRAGKLRD
jgi:hypothetical protein